MSIDSDGRIRNKYDLLRWFVGRTGSFCRFLAYSRGARHVREPRGGGGQAKKREIRRLFGRLTFYKKNGILTALNIERGRRRGKLRRRTGLKIMSDITKRAISASLKKLLREKKLNKITVQDIADDCGINRQTFYYHFQDIYDLVEWTCIEDTEKVLKENRTYATWQEGFLAVFYLAKEDKTFIENIYRSVSLELLEQYLYRLVYPLLKNVVDEKAKNYTVRDENKKYIADFYKYAFVGVLLEWIRNDMRESPESITDRVSKIVSGAIETAFNNFSRGQ